MPDRSLVTLADIVGALDRAGIPHMVAGSFASSRHGIPRSTADIDVVIDPTVESLDQMLEQLDEARFYVPVDFARQALRTRDQFNIVDNHTGWKVDLVIRKDRAFSRSEFARRQTTTIAGIDVSVATAEDTVLAKLEWAGATDSERQFRDVVDILRTLGDQLDDDYLDRWAQKLEVGEALARARRTAGVDHA